MSDIANSRLKPGVKEKFSVSREAPLQFGRFALLPIMELKPDPSNPRKHGREQIRAIARSIAAFGFNAPILIDRNKQIVAGHGRYEAAKLNQCAEVPVVWLEHLTETQARAYMLADNKLTDRSSWDDAALAVHLKELSELVLDFDIEDIGFELPEIDFRIQSLDAVDDADLADEFQLFPGFAVSRPSDLWLLGRSSIATTSNSAASDAIAPTSGTTPAPTAFRVKVKEALLISTPRLSRLHWFPTPFWIRRSAMTSFSLPFAAAARPYLPPSAPAGTVAASRSIRSMWTLQSRVGRE